MKLALLILIWIVATELCYGMMIKQTQEVLGMKHKNNKRRGKQQQQQHAIETIPAMISPPYQAYISAHNYSGVEILRNGSCSFVLNPTSQLSINVNGIIYGFISSILHEGNYQLNYYSNGFLSVDNLLTQKVVWSLSDNFPEWKNLSVTNNLYLEELYDGNGCKLYLAKNVNKNLFTLYESNPLPPTSAPTTLAPTTMEPTSKSPTTFPTNSPQTGRVKWSVSCAAQVPNSCSFVQDGLCNAILNPFGQFQLIFNETAVLFNSTPPFNPNPKDLPFIGVVAASGIVGWSDQHNVIQIFDPNGKEIYAAGYNACLRPGMAGLFISEHNESCLLQVVCDDRTNVVYQVYP